MNTPITRWVDLTLDQAQRCHHLAWFLYGCLEREHMLNVEAFAAWWVRALVSAPHGMLFPAAEPRPSALAASATKAPAADDTSPTPAQRWSSSGWLAPQASRRIDMEEADG